MFGDSNLSGDAPKPGPFGRFYLQELINSGGMAEIWLATDPSNRPFALRRMHNPSRFDFAAKRRFMRGCEMLAQISDHPAIVTYYEHGKIGGQPYLVMEYVEGANLKELYARHDEVLLENVAQIILDMAGGLEHMHNNGYMHLDFKPENVLVSRNAAVRLIDFDLAQPITEKPKKPSGKNPGTPAYMAPEQLQSQPITPRADIFSFGVAAYELLTNQKPFPGDTPTKILQQMLDRSSFVNPREYNPDLPPALERIILKCLEPEPERRYPFIGIMVRELQSILYVG